MGALLNAASVLTCPHGGSVTISTSNSRAKAGGAFIVRSSDTFSIAGCAFMLGSSPHPCVTVQWIVTTMKNQVSGSVLADDSVGLCLAADQAPQGSVVVSSTQSQVKGL